MQDDLWTVVLLLNKQMQEASHVRVVYLKTQLSLVYWAFEELDEVVLSDDQHLLLSLLLHDGLQVRHHQGAESSDLLVVG